MKFPLSLLALLSPRRATREALDEAQPPFFSLFMVFFGWVVLYFITLHSLGVKEISASLRHDYHISDSVAHLAAARLTPTLLIVAAIASKIINFTTLFGLSLLLLLALRRIAPGPDLRPSCLIALAILVLMPDILDIVGSAIGWAISAQPKLNPADNDILKFSYLWGVITGSGGVLPPGGASALWRIALLFWAVKETTSLRPRVAFAAAAAPFLVFYGGFVLLISAATGT